MFENPLRAADPDGHDSIDFNSLMTNAPAGCGIIEQTPTGPCPQQDLSVAQAWESRKSATDAVDNGATQDAQAVNSTPRSVELTEAVLNVSLAVGKARLASELALTDTVPGALSAGYVTLSAGGNVAAAGFQTVGAVTGLTDTTEKAAEITGIAASATGMGTLVATKGDVEKAALAAAAEGIVTSNPKDLMTGGTLERVAKAHEFIENAHKLMPDVRDAIHNWIHPVPVE